MNAASHPDTRFRHVIFPDIARAAGRALDDRPPAVSAAPAALSGEEHSFLEWLFVGAGLDLSAYKIETLRRRLPVCLRVLRTHDLAGARAAAVADPATFREAVSAIVIGVTHFVRDAHVFSYLGGRVLPELAARPGRLRVWSAGCSDGAELYSVALLLEDLGLLDRCELLGTDCRLDALEQARAGRYNDRAVRELPPDLLRRHFTPDGGGWRVSDRLRAAARWRTGNVLTGPEPGTWDLVLCRNLALYLRPDAAGALWRNLAAAVRPGGILVLGKAERPGCGRRFGPAGACVYRRSEVGDAA